MRSSTPRRAVHAGFPALANAAGAFDGGNQLAEFAGLSNDGIMTSDSQIQGKLGA